MDIRFGFNIDNAENKMRKGLLFMRLKPSNKTNYAYARKIIHITYTSPSWLPARASDKNLNVFMSLIAFFLSE